MALGGAGRARRARCLGRGLRCRHGRRDRLAPLLAVAVVLLLLPAPGAQAGPRYSSRIVHTQSGAIRGVIVEPASRRLEPVEVFRGVPYAGRPPRLGPPPPPPSWTDTRLADEFAPVCPQRLPDLANKSAALESMPLGRYNQLLAALPALTNQSEDCLYLNIYVPGSGARGVEAPYAVLAWLGGGSFEWGSASGLDGAVLASRAHLLVLTINYRLGLLGFLSPKGAGAGATGGASSVQAEGSCAALDVLAALRWVRANVASFGGDPARVTLAGHDTAAALASLLLASPSAHGLFSRAILMSGSSLSPWATAPDPALMRKVASEALHCTPDFKPDVPDDDGWLAACVRARPLEALLAVEPPRARFLSGWAPSVPASPGTLLGAPHPARALHTSDTFLECALMIGVVTTESYNDFGEEDVKYGFEEEYRNRVLRTYVRNVYQYHRNEIFAAIRNEYTDWDKPIQHPINIRDATLEALSDAATAAPALRLAQMHARRGATTYFFHFAHQTKDSEYPQRLGSVRGEALPYLLGQPLLQAGSGHNYSRADAAVADSTLALLAAFIKTGAPTPPAQPAATAQPAQPALAGLTWPRYELGAQQYLSISSKPKVKSHYRGHKMALWLHLVPQLHRPGAAPAHHQLRAAYPHLHPPTHIYAGEIFPERAAGAAGGGEDEPGGHVGVGAGAQGDECGTEGEVEGDSEGQASPRPALPAQPSLLPQEADLLAIADTHYYSYTVALGVTVGVGCFLLALNALVFAGIYYQRGRRSRRRRRSAAAARLHREGSIQVSAGLGSGTGSICHIKPGRCGSPALHSSLKRSGESEMAERPPCAGAPVKKRVHIQEISV